MSRPGNVIPWMSAWVAAQREFPTGEMQQKLAGYAQDYAAIAAAFWNQLQSPRPDFDTLREPLTERYQQLFMPPGVQATERFARLAAAIAIDACERLRAALDATGPDAPPLTSLRELHALWIECGEAAYAHAAQSEEFAAAQAELLAALVDLRAGARAR